MRVTPDQRREIEESRNAEQSTRRTVAPGLEAILYRPLPVLDHGFIRVIDYMGDDAAVVQAARVSYGKGTRRRREDSRLIAYLMRHRHTTPFEMCEIKLHVKLPIFVARQWIRHRTANVNEYSARYSRLDREFYVPDPLHLQAVLEERGNRRRESRRNTPDLFEVGTLRDERSALAAQSASNKQGRDGAVADDEARDALSRIDWISKNAYGVYESLLNEDATGARKHSEYAGLARELARTVLPVNYFTQFYWKIDLHNLMHFLTLRSDRHAQFEIRAYADVMLDLLRRWVPLTYEAFREHGLDAVHLSASALAVVRKLVRGEAVTQGESELSPREWRELMAALEREA